jgi:profilin
MCHQGDGAVLAQTKQAILVATYIHPQTAQEAGIIVTKLGAYLVEVGY